MQRLIQFQCSCSLNHKARRTTNAKRQPRGSRAQVRLGVGDDRVIFVDGTIIDVVRIGPRGSIYGA